MTKALINPVSAGCSSRTNQLEEALGGSITTPATTAIETLA
jgi:hypothetical protein